MSNEPRSRKNVYNDIRVHILDPDARTTEAVSVLLRLEGFRTTISTDLDGLASLFDRQPAHVLLLNGSAQTGDGTHPLQRTRMQYPTTAVILLQDLPDLEGAVRAFRIGAVDVLPKPLDTTLLLSAVKRAVAQPIPLVRTVASTDPVDQLTPAEKEVHQRLLKKLFAERRAERLGRLTPRENQVLQFLLNGLSNREVGIELGVSTGTIEAHRAEIRRKLGATSVADLVRKALGR